MVSLGPDVCSLTLSVSVSVSICVRLGTQDIGTIATHTQQLMPTIQTEQFMLMGTATQSNMSALSLLTTCGSAPASACLLLQAMKHECCHSRRL